MGVRVALATAGVLLGLFGVFRLLTQIPLADLMFLALWLIGAVAIHDGVLSPIVLGVGAALRRYVPARARAFAQGGLIVGALITVIALPMIHRAYSQPRVKAILQQNFAANLGVLLAVVAGGSVLLYVAKVVLDSRRPVADGEAPTAGERSGGG